MKNFSKILTTKNKNILKNTLYFDIETTGFINTSSYTYMIGMFYIYKDSIRSTYLFAENSIDEKDILIEFENILSNFNTVCTFNGDKFDIPYLLWRYEKLNLKTTLNVKKSIDMFKDFKKLKRFLPLENLKQKSFERFLQHYREDKFTGGELISLYKEYSFTGDKKLEDIIILHNVDDIYGMTLLPSLYDYLKINSSKYIDYKIENNSLILIGENDSTFIKEISFNSCNYTLNLFNNTIHIKIPILNIKLNYFFNNYNDYYYLLKENSIIHKNLGTYVDKKYRRNAKKEECFIEKTSNFIPNFNIIDSKIYKHNIKSKEEYLDINELNIETFSNIYQNILNKLLT